MRNKRTRLVLCARVAVLTAVWAFAQDDTDTIRRAMCEPSPDVSPSGGGNDYLLTASDGSTWEIHENSAANLAKHANQTVEVKGVVANSKAHNM